MSKKKKIKPIHEKGKPAEESVVERADTESMREAGKEALDEKRNLKDIADDIIVSYEARVKVVGGIIEDTHKMMDGFKEKRETMAKELQDILAKCESLRKKDFDRMMVDIVARQNEREKEVRNMLETFRKEEEMVAERLKQLLTKGEEIRIKDFKKMMADIRQEQERRVKQTGESIVDQLQDMRGEVHTMLDNFKKERQSVAAAWHEMLGLFRQEKSPAPKQSLRHATGQANPGNPGNPEEDIKNDNDNK